MSEYKRYVSNSTKEYKKQCWDMATGLQAVDNLTPTKYLYELSEQHIEGYMTLNEIQTQLYKSYQSKKADDNRDKEADIVSCRIVQLLDEKAFSFSPVTLKGIHRFLFGDIYDHAGQYRKYNITKEEEILNGETVNYSNWQMIEETLAYDFEEERRKSYEGLSDEMVVKRIAKFTSDIWQVHPFMEGNTRTTALFVERYLNSYGFNVDNTLFRDNAKYFRNALVRANFANYQRGISEDMTYLIRFYENLLLGKENLLQNREMYLPKLFKKPVHDL